MQRLALLIAVSVLGVAAAGCGGAKITLPPVAAAPPQQVRVDWLEPTDTKSTSPRLIFEVKRIEVGDDGWKADVAIRNETEVPWALGGPTATSSVPFGVMLFATGDHEELEQRVNQRELPGVRDAHTAQPPPPEVLEPGATWEGTVACSRRARSRPLAPHRLRAAVRAGLRAGRDAERADLDQRQRLPAAGIGTQPSRASKTGSPRSASKSVSTRAEPRSRSSRANARPRCVTASAVSPASTSKHARS